MLLVVDSVLICSDNDIQSLKKNAKMNSDFLEIGSILIDLHSIIQKLTTYYIHQFENKLKRQLSY